MPVDGNHNNILLLFDSVPS